MFELLGLRQVSIIRRNMKVWCLILMSISSMKPNEARVVIPTRFSTLKRCNEIFESKAFLEGMFYWSWPSMAETVEPSNVFSLFASIFEGPDNHVHNFL